MTDQVIEHRLRIDRTQVDAVVAHYLNRALERRERNMREGSCINEREKVKTHGLATHGVRCFRCYLVHKYGAEEARRLPEYKAARPVFVLGEEDSSYGAAGPVRSAATDSEVAA